MLFFSPLPDLTNPFATMKPTGYSLLFLLMLLALPAQAQQFGGAVAVSGPGEVVVGRTAETPGPGTLYVFRQDADGNWIESQRLQASYTDGTDDRFGRALTVKGDRMLVGATTHENNRGGAFLFERDADGTWIEVEHPMASDGVEEDYLGRAVGLAGDYAFVTAAGKNEDAGAAYVFHRGADGTWAEHGMLTASDAAPETFYGLALAADGDYVFVGTPNADSTNGVVYVYQRQGDQWNEVQRLSGPAGSRFGSALAVEGTRALIGAPTHEGNLGAAFVYRLDGGTWSEAATLLPFDGEQGRLGSSVALHGDEAWAGSPGAMQFQGAVYRFVRGDDGAWTHADKITAEATGPGDFAAGALAVGETLAVVGASGADYGEGVAVVFERTAGGWAERAEVFDTKEEAFASITGDRVPCADGEAGTFACEQVDLLSFLSLDDLGAGRGVRTNDVWGWTDPETGIEYALVGRVDGTSFISLADPENPVVVGELPMTEGARGNSWRDIKVYQNHAYIVADGAGQHGMQVFDLTRLRGVDDPPVRFDADVIYDQIASAHNIVINEETGFAYSVGSSSGGETCGGGLHMIDVREPQNPTFAGCFADPTTGRRKTGYSHDAQCVTYRGPDAAHQGKEICFGANETALSIADVTDKDNPVPLSMATYPKVAYTHQGWLTEDQTYFYMNDEGDEPQGLVEGTRTLIWDVSDLDDPVLVAEHIAETTSTDHNLYIKGNLMYQSNYNAGFRILDITDPANPVEVAYFDTVPYDGGGGSWSNYPYFESGTIIVTSMREGLFLLKEKTVDL